ncbi:hypothetical protein GCM10009534_52870 [Kribbella sandramycini]
MRRLDPSSSGSRLRGLLKTPRYGEEFPAALLLLGGGVAPVVCGVDRLDQRFGPALLGRQRGHQSVDRHASETPPGPGYDGNFEKFLDVT